MSRWPQLWQHRGLPEPAAGRSVLGELLAADGLDSGFAAVTEEAWAAAIQALSRTLRLEPGMSVFEVGCGAGAWLYPLAQVGHQVEGIDLSPVLIARATEVMPEGRFTVAEAADPVAGARAALVASFGVFMYLDDLAHAESVLDRMVERATHAVVVLDVPDLAVREADLARRHAVAGGREAYEERYAGLDHLAFDRDWMVAALEARGLVGVTAADQSVQGYGNTPFRFNAWGFVDGPGPRAHGTARSVASAG